MSMASNYISGILNEQWYDVTEEYSELLSQWYGDDLSLFDTDDEDLAICLRRLSRTFRYWRTNPGHMTPYEKLRRDYEALTEQCRALIDDNAALRAETTRLLADCRESARTKKKRSCRSKGKERKEIRNGRFVA
jgi:hypothetical protein